MTTKEFTEAVNGEYDIETLELMQDLIDQRLNFLRTLVDVGATKRIKGFKRYDQ
jgi:hypothetical protein